MYVCASVFLNSFQVGVGCGCDACVYMCMLGLERVYVCARMTVFWLS